MAITPHASKQDFEAAFKGFQYPMSKSAILNMGRDKGGLDREVARVLARIPDRKYRDVDEVRAAVRGVYRAMGVPEDGLPL
ncbi:MAG: DUF2795 domain-containing protein [Chloroflexi bacterium]|nr:DUF2795 domain-containing protein [Chloroflexota bacterium]